MAKSKERNRTPRQRRRYRARGHVWLERNSDTPRPGKDAPFDGGHFCHYCELWYKKKHITRDHIVPRAWGGVDEDFNIVPACRGCNMAKGSKPPTCICAYCQNSIEQHAEIWRAQGLDLGEIA